MSLSGKSLLIVDDDPQLLHLIGMVVGQAGMTVRSAEDGFKALAELEAAVPDLILADLNTSGMSGFELLAIVRRRFPEVRVIAMSGIFRGPDVPKGVAADAFYEKASDPEILVETLRTLADSVVQVKKRHESGEIPAWVAHQGNSFVVVSCTSCLRTFRVWVESSNEVVRDAHCIYCRTRINYAVVEAAMVLSRQKAFAS